LLVYSQRKKNFILTLFGTIYRKTFHETKRSVTKIYTYIARNCIILHVIIASSKIESPQILVT